METILKNYPTIGSGEFARQKPGILKFINYKNADIDRFHKSLKYVTNPAATNEYLQHFSLLSRNDPVSHIKAVTERFAKSPSTRLFKHLVFCYGDYWLEEKAIMEFTRQVMDHLTGANSFPYMFAVHNNGKRPHSHALLCCTSLYDGHQFSQSHSELEELKDFYDQLAREKGFPLLLRKNKKSTPGGKGVMKIDGKYILAREPCNTSYEDSYYVPCVAPFLSAYPNYGCQYPQCNTTVLQQCSPSNAVNQDYDCRVIPDLSLSQLWGDYRTDCKNMMLMGLKLGLDNNNQ